MPARRKLILALAVLCALCALIYVYWVWDSTSVTAYVPYETGLIVRCRGMEQVLESIGFEHLQTLLPEDIQELTSVVYSPIAPGLNPMDLGGQDIAVFVTPERSSSLVEGAVVVTRISQKAKLAETIAALIGRTHRVNTPSGRSVRTVELPGYDYSVFYKREDRLLIMSRSLDALDEVLRDAAPKTEILPAAGPVLAFGVHTDAVMPLSKLLSSQRSQTAAAVSTYLKGLSSLDGTVTFGEKVSVQAMIVPAGWPLPLTMYRAEGYKPFNSSVLDLIPYPPVYCVSAAYPLLMRQVSVQDAFTNTLFHEVADILGGVSLFRGEIMTAVTVPDDAEVPYLAVRTDKTRWPADIISILRSGFSKSVGELSLFDRQAGGDIYSIAPLHQGYAPAYVWISGTELVVCPSNAALDGLLTGLRRGITQPPVFSDKADLFAFGAPSPRHRVLQVVLGLAPEMDQVIQMIGHTVVQASATDQGVIINGSVSLKLSEGE